MRRVLNRVFLGMAGCALLVLLAALAWRAFSTTPPLCDGCNIILISLDAVSADSLLSDPSSFPLLAKRANRDGAVFTHAYAPANRGISGQAAILTGAYPWDIGVLDGSTGIPVDTHSVAEALFDYGYDTAGFSLGSFIDAPWGFSRGFALWNHPKESTAELFADASAWIKTRGGSQKPFFLYIDPYEIYGLLDKPESNGFTYANLVAAENGDQAAAARFRGGYAHQLSLLDTEIDKLIDSAGEKTVVVLTASYGQDLVETISLGTTTSRLPTNRVLNVPLVYFIPGHTPVRISSTVESRSTAATILDIVGADASVLPGTSLAPYIDERLSKNMIARARVDIDAGDLPFSPAEFYKAVARLNPTTVIVPSHATPSPLLKGRDAISLIYDVWHLIEAPDGTKFLFNTARDPAESKSVMGEIQTYSPQERQAIGVLMTALLSGK